MRYFHGGKHPVTNISPTQLGADGELLCASASVNVARRYGAVITEFELSTDKTVSLSVHDWFTGDKTIESLRAAGYDALIVTANSGVYDFPADTVFVINPSALSFKAQLTEADITAMDDGHPTVHEPDGPGANGWDLWVANVYCGDEAAALEDLGIPAAAATEKKIRP